MHEAKKPTFTSEGDPAAEAITHRSVKFWAPVLDLSERTLRDAIRNGELGFIRIGDRVLLSRRHVEAWLASNERKPRANRAA